MRSGDQGDLVPLEDEDPVTELVAEASDVYAPTQAQLARAIGVQPLALTQWRGGKRRPSPDSLRKMARELVRQSDQLRYLALKLEQLAAQEVKRRRRKRLSS
jgi:DNA-binding XRE family transcriptional regulator